MLISRSEYARRRGVDPSLITRWAKAQRIVVAGNGQIDAEASDALLAQTMDPARGGRGGKSDRKQPVAPPASAETSRKEQQPDQYARVRTHREAFAAKTAEAQYKRMIGQLVEADRAARAAADTYGSVRRALQRLPDVLAGRMAAESDQRKCRALLAAEIEAMLAELATKIAGLPGNADPGTS